MSYILVFCCLTVIALILGLISMASGEKISQRFGTKLMSLRVAFQALAILALAIIYLFGKQSAG